jgi:hypothetical protein
MNTRTTHGRLIAALASLAIFGVASPRAVLAEGQSGTTLTLNAQERRTDPGMLPEAASGTSAYVEPFAVPLAPGVYLANFMLVYFSSPELAANMPAYRAALPQEVYECLVQYPEGGCYYPDMAKYFAEQALEIGGSRNKNTFWPSSCQIDPRWQALAVPEYRQPDQINQPLGRKKGSYRNHVGRCAHAAAASA